MNAIVKGLFVGDMSEVESAQRQEMDVLSVMWGEEDGSPKGVHNIQTTYFNMEPMSALTTHVDCEKMNEAADWIHERLDRGERVMVHCAFGMERSPLTVVWYLMRHHNYTLDEAYRIVKINRPMTQDRKHWLPMNWETMVHDGVSKEAA